MTNEEPIFTEQDQDELKHSFTLGIRRLETEYFLSLFYNHGKTEVDLPLWNLTLSNLKKEKTQTGSLSFTKRVFEETDTNPIDFLLKRVLFLMAPEHQEIVYLMSDSEKTSLSEAIEEKIKELD